MMEELGVPYKTKLWEFQNLKTPEFEKMNPNGRTPVIEDPNTGITLWEVSCWTEHQLSNCILTQRQSGAIVEYLVETYDKDNTFTYTQSPEKYQLKQWYVQTASIRRCTH